MSELDKWKEKNAHWWACSGYTLKHPTVPTIPYPFERIDNGKEEKNTSAQENA